MDTKGRLASVGNSIRRGLDRLGDEITFASNKFSEGIMAEVRGDHKKERIFEPVSQFEDDEEY